MLQLLPPPAIIATVTATATATASGGNPSFGRHASAGERQSQGQSEVTDAPGSATAGGPDPGSAGRDGGRGAGGSPGNSCGLYARGFVAKLGDFGLARLLKPDGEDLLVSKHGTVGTL